MGQSARRRGQGGSKGHLALAAGSLACAALALSPSPGQAQGALVAIGSSSRPLLAGPALEGHALVWATAGRDETDVVQSEVPGQSPVTLGDLAGGHGSLALVASPQQLVVSRSLEFCSGRDSCSDTYGYWRAAAGETLTGFSAPVYGAVQVSGEWIGYNSFTVSNPFEPATAPLNLGGLTHPDLAYPYVASVRERFEAGASVMASNAETGAVVLQVPEGPGGSFPESDELDAMQSDGTVIVNAPQPAQLARASTGGLPGWASLAQPSLHPLTALDGAIDITIADGLVAGELRPAAEVTTERLRVVNLAGTVIAERAVPSPVGSLAFDGAQLAWAQEPCTVAYASVWNLSEAPPAAPDARCAVAGVSVPPSAERRHGSHLYVTLSCPASATATGCPGRLWVRARLARKVGPGAQGLAILGHVSYELAAGQQRRIAIELNRRLRRFLAAGTVIVHATAIATRPTGERPTDDPGVAGLRFTLRPPSRHTGTSP